MNALKRVHLVMGMILGVLCKYSGGSIDCYVCSSNNGSNSRCQDPFHPAYSNITKNCRQGREGRVGLFPARYCTKIKGTSANGLERIIRSCSINTLETMCGNFKLEGVTYTGCIDSCEKDACNSSYRSATSYGFVTVIIYLLTRYWINCLR